MSTAVGNAKCLTIRAKKQQQRDGLEIDRRFMANEPDCSADCARLHRPLHRTKGRSHSWVLFKRESPQSDWLVKNVRPIWIGYLNLHWYVGMAWSNFSTRPEYALSYPDETLHAVSRTFSKSVSLALMIFETIALNPVFLSQQLTQNSNRFSFLNHYPRISPYRSFRIPTLYDKYLSRSKIRVGFSETFQMCTHSYSRIRVSSWIYLSQQREHVWWRYRR
jgi:hypothetical protein